MEQGVKKDHKRQGLGIRGQGSRNKEQEARNKGFLLLNPEP